MRSRVCGYRLHILEAFMSTTPTGQKIAFDPASLLYAALRQLKERLAHRHRRGAKVLAAADEDRIQAMMAAVDAGPEQAQPSLFWRKMNVLNAEQLAYAGYNSFKRTVALNYFTFVNILPWDPQVRTLLRTIPLRRTLHIAWRSLTAPSADFFSSVSWIQTRIYVFLTLAMRERLLGLALPPPLLDLQEPLEGGAIDLKDDLGRRTSADLCNSIMEYRAARAALAEAPGTVLELGGGYGRTAFVWLSLEKSRYIMVDVAPALWVAERYLSSIFPDRRVFHWRPFETYQDIRAEFEASDLCFLTADQLALLPQDSVDLGLNISSLHEMTADKIAFFLEQFDRILRTSGNFYLKAWKRSVLPVDNVVTERADYPIPAHWQLKIEATTEFHPDFFEVVYEKRATDAPLQPPL